MIAVDTNVVIRLLVEDDAGQLRKARELLDDARERKEECLLTNPVLCEIGWVLGSAYNASRQDIATALQRLVSSGVFVFENAATVRGALDRFVHSKADYSDCLIGLQGADSGAKTTYTFDRALRGVSEFTLLR